MVNLLFLLPVLFIVYKSLILMFKRNERRGNFISFGDVTFLFMVYVNVLIGFGIIFTIFQMEGVPVIVEAGVPLSGGFFEIMGEALYFSAITILSVGYGDLTPIGIGRLFAILEALIGYVIPAAFVVKSMIENPSIHSEEFPMEINSSNENKVGEAQYKSPLGSIKPLVRKKTK